MNAFLDFPERLHWDAQQLADAVPLRLFELLAFDPADARPSANLDAPRAARSRGHSYLPYPAQSSLFRVRG